MARKQIEIVYQDDNVIVINKPSGVSVTKDRNGKTELVELLSEQLYGAERLLLIHRLDKPTSGVMILAKNTETQSRLSGDFENRLIRKTYLAIVDGFVDEPSGGPPNMRTSAAAGVRGSPVSTPEDRSPVSLHEA